MIINDKITIPEKLRGTKVQIGNDHVNIPYTADTIRIFPFKNKDKACYETGFELCGEDGDSKGAGVLKMNIVEFCERGGEYFR